MVIELALQGITPFWLAAGRISFATLLTGAIWTSQGRKLFAQSPNKTDIQNVVFIGLLSSALPFMMLSWGQQYVTSGFAGVSMAAVALIVLPLAHFLVPGERMTWRRALGFIIGFIGVIILVGTRAFESTGASLELLGRFACLGAAACYAVSSIQMRRLPAIDPVGLSTILLFVGAVFVVPMAWIMEGPPPMPSGSTLIYLAFLGMVPTAGANLLRVIIIRSAGPVFMSLTNYQVPVWSIILGASILGEPLPQSLLVAMVLILCGVGLSQYGALRRLFGGKNGT